MKIKTSIFLILALTLGVTAVAQNRSDLRGTSRPGSSQTASQQRSDNTDTQSDSTAKDEALKGIDYNHVDEADSTLVGAVFAFPGSFRQVKILRLIHPSMEPDGVSYFNPLDNPDAPLYLQAGNLGHPCLSVWPLLSTGGQLAEWVAPQVFAPLSKTPANILFYQTRRPYSALRYSGSLSADNQFGVTHTQNITPRWNVAFDLDLVKRTGTYARSGVDSRQMGITTNYYSRDSRYQIQAGLVRNNIAVEENGGIADDAIFRAGKTNSSGIPVRLYSANSQWRTVNLFVHQSFNTVRQVPTPRPRHIAVAYDTLVVQSGDTLRRTLTRDSVIGYDTLLPHPPHSYNTGVFGLDLAYSRWKRNYYDNAPDESYYPQFFFDTAATYDSTTAHTLRADLFWTNDAYPDARWRNPFKLKIGVTPQLKAVTSADSAYRWGTLSPFASLELFHSLRLQADVTILGAHESGDHQLSATLPLSLGKYTNVLLAARAEQHSPQWLYHHYSSNNYQWDNADLSKISTQQISAQLSNKLFFRRDTAHTGNYSLQTALLLQSTRIDNNIWLTQLHPFQTSRAANLLQSDLQLSLAMGWFHCQLHQMMQQSSDPDIVRVPTFASKNVIYADFFIFKKALHIQTGFDLRYHSRYYADAYSPALGTFYRQDEAQVGGNLWADFFVNLKIHQACIYAKVGHVNAPLEPTRNYYLLPNYPGEALGVYWGITWQFFN